MQIPPKKSIELEKLAKNKFHCKSSIENLKYRVNIKFPCNKTCVCKNVGHWHQMHLAELPKVAKTTKKQRRGTLSLFVPSAICGLIDVDALDFPPMDLMDPDALAGNGSNAIWRDWRAGP